MSTPPVQPTPAQPPENLQPADSDTQNFLIKAATLTTLLTSLQQLLLEVKGKGK